MAGQQPILGAHVYLLASNATGVGAASVRLLEPNSTGQADAIGTYVLSASDGSFTIPGYYTCTSSQQLYIYSLGGDAGLGPNSAAGELAVLGNCPAPGSTVPPVVMNEVTTVAAAFALAPFATDALHVSSSGTPLAQLGIANAFANAFKLASTVTGAALTIIPAGTATVPQGAINTLANLLNACIHSSKSASAPCVTLFSDTQISDSVPTDTATAMINIVHHPATNVGALFALQSTTSPFAPSLSAAPNDYTVGIVYTGGGMAGVTALDVDAQGDVWFLSEGSGYTSYVGSIGEISPSGGYLSGSNGYAVSLFAPAALAIDTIGNVWIANYAADLTANTSIVELSNNGTVLSGSNGFNGGGMYLVSGLSFDASGNLWAANANPNTLTEMTTSGQFLSGMSGFTGGGLNFPLGLANGASGNVWVANGESMAVSEFTGSGQPVTGANGLTVPGFYGGNAVAIDAGGNVWFSRQGGYAQVSKLSNSGAVLSGPTGFVDGGIAAYKGGKRLSIDGDGNVWIPLYNGPGVAELSNAGVVLSGAAGFQSGILLFPACVALDGSGDVWISSSQSAPKPTYYTDRITELIGIAAPVVTPLAAGVKNNTLGTRP
jgi:hypothetical protein